METVLSNGFKDHQTLKLSIKLAALIKVITLSKSLLFVPKVVPLVISDVYAGSATDRFITEDTNIGTQFTTGYSVLFDKGFNVQDLFLKYNVNARIPPFVRSKRQLTQSEVAVGKRIARARIHIEHANGQLKEFRLLDHTLPLNLVDLLDKIWIIAGALTNMQPPLVKN